MYFWSMLTWSRETCPTTPDTSMDGNTDCEMRNRGVAHGGVEERIL